MRRKMITLCVTVLFILACSINVFAQDFDMNKTGSISVSLIEQDKKEPIIDAKLRVYHVATVRMNVDGTIGYVYTDDFENVGVDLTDATLTKKLNQFVSNNKIESIKMTTDKTGTANCKGLALGLYFVKQTEAVEGFASCTPFVVTVPSEKAGKYVYDVDASPKTEVSRFATITIKKKWNTDKSTAATERVTVQLLRDGDVVKTATLHAQNDWQVTYKNMPESDDYSVKEVNVPKGFTATYSKAGYVFTVTNTSTLIQTGQLIWPIPVLAVSGMIFIVIGIVLSKKRKTNA